ncbi:hydroxymethylbilane synthase [Actinomadura rupiterrae]|uniref:hydroxymethylbilane synthase n=1 Tax=Actinomadura rupiterrae TaxID=559627 RepID=UPI0020A3A613|nr:hydroxymethylbilane synthase [Actinomadura rupiterrae]MCP2342398.1 hydroxymethylbilane synthase [Actinomadura rupiterrae]
MLNQRRIRLGSRKSPMAMAQARHVQGLITGLADGPEVEIVGIQTSGDTWQGDLAALGGKGSFLKEIDKALVAGEIDMAVNCLKDIPGDVPLPSGTLIAAYLERDDVHDAVVFPAGSEHRSLADLPPGALVATSAVRRKAQLLRLRPDLRVERIRGNVNTRLAKLDGEHKSDGGHGSDSEHGSDGEREAEDGGGFDALIVASAGLERIGMTERIGEVLPLDEMVPAVGAGVLTVHARESDLGLIELLRQLDDPETQLHATAERSMLHGLQGHCNSPIAGYCTSTPDGRLSLIGMVFTSEGDEFVRVQETDESDRARELGALVASTLARKGALDIIEGIPH